MEKMHKRLEDESKRDFIKSTLKWGAVLAGAAILGTSTPKIINYDFRGCVETEGKRINERAYEKLKGQIRSYKEEKAVEGAGWTVYASEDFGRCDCLEEKATFPEVVRVYKHLNGNKTGPLKGHKIMRPVWRCD